MSKKAGAAIALGIIGFFAIAAIYSNLHPDDAPPFVFSFPDDVQPSTSLLTLDQRIAYAEQTHDLINEQRIAEGIRPLAWNDNLASVATRHSEWMADNGQYVHSTTFCRAENVMMDFGWLSPEEAVSAWMGSELHRDNIMNSFIGSEGIGIAQAQDGKTYYTQNMC